MKRLLLFTLILFALHPYFLTSVQAESAEDEPSLSSEAAVLMDAETGDILYDKNANQSMYPASLTKIATAIYTIETVRDLNEMVTVSERAAEAGGSSVYLEEDEQVSLKKLLQGLLINSGNDAAVAIAEHVDGSVEEFAKHLNEYLEEEIGVTDTHFTNPHGLFDSDHETTAYDMALITKYAAGHETFRNIFRTVKLDWHGKSWDTTLITHHKLMRERPYEGVTGGKTGFVNESGFTLATTAEQDDLHLIAITLGARFEQDAYDDTVKLFDEGFDNFEHSTIEKGTIVVDGSDEYKVPQNLTFTHKVDEPVCPQMRKDGEWELNQQNGSKITSFSLKRINDKQASETNESAASESKFSLKFIISAVILIALITAFKLWRKRRRQKRIFM